MNCHRKTLIAVLLILAGFCLVGTCEAQGISYNYFYRVYFKDKGLVFYNNYPTQYLSQRAVLRREKYKIHVPDIYDIPVKIGYITAVSSFGLTFHCSSRWMNTALFKSTAPVDMAPVLNLPFVENIKVVKKPAGKGLSADKLGLQLEQANSFPFDNPIKMLHGDILHTNGLTGKGILIAVLDGGFYLTDEISSLTQLRLRNGIVATRDFITGAENVYGYHYHGTAVMSVLAGLYDGYIEGSAPGADYCLVRTEDTSSEFPVEEDYWAAGAEYADSLGADIISSSLGYYAFDDSTMNYKFQDMNGRNTFITRAAEIAASKGILVVTSAGNERTGSWKRIIAPTDGDSVLSAGAVDGNNIISSFSSAGPSADGRIKPDNVAQGVRVPVQIETNTFGLASGTSLSCPLLSGVCACALQAAPEIQNKDLIDLLHECGDRHSYPDSLYGYGLPDMIQVIESLENKFLTRPENSVTIGPNPFFKDLNLIFRDAPGSIEIRVYNTSGSLVAYHTFAEYISRSLIITDLENSSQGLYLVRLKTSVRTYYFKVIKIRA